MGPKTGTTNLRPRKPGVMAIKGYSTFPKAPGLKFDRHMQSSVIPRTLVLFDQYMGP